MRGTTILYLLGKKYGLGCALVLMSSLQLGKDGLEKVWNLAAMCIVLRLNEICDGGRCQRLLGIDKKEYFEKGRKSIMCFKVKDDIVDDVVTEAVGDQNDYAIQFSNNFSEGEQLPLSPAVAEFAQAMERVLRTRDANDGQSYDAFPLENHVGQAAYIVEGLEMVQQVTELLRGLDEDAEPADTSTLAFALGATQLAVTAMAIRAVSLGLEFNTKTQVASATALTEGE